MGLGFPISIALEAGRMKADLVLLKNDGAYKTFPLTSNVVIIGRRHDCDLQIPLPTVSRRHCQITQNGQALKIRDLGSKAGTFVNDKRIGADGEGRLKPGDYIRIGPLVFLCQIDGKPEKVVPPKKPATQPAAAKPKSQPKKPAADALDEDLGDLAEKPSDGLDDSFADLDASDSFIGLDEDEDEKDSKSK
jgi:predicted component of type VI protein secretion system